MLQSPLAAGGATATPQRLAVPRKADAANNILVGRQPVRQPQRAGHGQAGLRGFDLVLSSGFLAFANHAGFLAAVEDVGLPVNAVMGTSAGALTGSLFCAGFSATKVAEILSCTAPIKRLRPCYHPWAGGLLSMEAVVEELAGLLPARFEDLQRPLGVGIASASGRHLLVDSGSLPASVAASAAIPYVFAPVEVPGIPDGPFMDGGVRCRIGLQLWRQGKYGAGAAPGTAPPAVVHLIGRSSPFSGNDDTSDFGRQNAVVLKAPKSGKNFFDLGDFDAEFEAARRRALPVLQELMERHAEAQQQQQQLQGGEDDEQQWQQPRSVVAI